MAAAPTDYDYSGFYTDGPCIIKSGVKDGQPYWNETELELSEEMSEDEIRAVFEQA